jgi:NCS1 family nucleobase:cation symporter-1
MNQPENADWQHRVLSESELNQVLLSMSSLDAISVLQRQVELRTLANGDAPSAGRASQDSLDAPTPNQPFTAVPNETPAPKIQPLVEESDEAISPVNIAADLNAIFAARATALSDIDSKPTSPEAEPEVVSTGTLEAEPEVVSTGTLEAEPQVPLTDASAFVPTFANPVPPSRLAGYSTPVSATTSAPVPSAPEPGENEVVPLLAEPLVIPTAQVPVDDFKESIWTQDDTDDSSSAEERITAEEDLLEPASRLQSDIVPVENAVQPEIQVVELESLEGLEPVDSKQVFELPDHEEVENFVALQPEPQGRRSAISLFTTWNGNGTLLLLTVTGFLAAQSGLGLGTLLAGVFAALFLSGFGFAAAALAARRGRLPQSVLARATYGVIGSNIPLAVVVIARVAATSLVSIFAVTALLWFFPLLPATFEFQSGSTTYSVQSLYPLLFGLVIVAGLVAFVAKRIYYSVARIIALVLIAWSVGAVGLSLWLKPSIYSFAKAVSYPDAMWVATALIIVLGLLWGTSASDETPDLKSSTVVPKLVATSLLNSTIIGSLAVVAGFALFQMNLPAIHSATTGSIFVVVLVFALANLIRRNTDAFRGFGLMRTPGWLFALNILLVAASALALAYRLGITGAWTNSVGYLYFVGVPVLAWVTTFGMDSVLRRTDYHEVSLMRGYGFYGRFNWANLIGWILATGIGWGFVQSNLMEFGWLGYFWRILGFSGQTQFLGVWIAMGLGLLVPLIFTVPRIRDQEAEVAALEARRTELADVLGIAD